MAEKISECSDYPRIKIGSIIVHKNRIISFGRNQIKTHRVQFEYNKFRNYSLVKDSIHSEIDAIVHSKSIDLSGCRIYIFRRLRNGDLGNCRPCEGCYKALQSIGIKEVYYTDENGYNRLYIGCERMVG